jgi:branched-chain amino acid transport system substrate-binding protein
MTTASGRKFSALIVVALFIVGIVVGTAVGYFGLKSSGPTSTTNVQTGLSGTITIGALLPITGAISAGSAVTTAINLGITDVNNWLNSTGNTNVKFAVKIDDTQTSPAVALTDMQSLSAAGVKVFVGPMTSSEVSNILSYADSNHLVMLETGTSATIAAANPYRYMIVPSDDLETQSLASLVYQRGYTHVVIIWRDDSWGGPFSHAFTTAYQALGGKVLDNVSYAPSATDFTTQLTQLQTDYNSAVSTYGTGKVAVVAMAFDELAAILNQAKSYSPLLNAQWFTDDTEVQTTATISNAGTLAAQVHLFGLVWTPTVSAKQTAFQQEYYAAQHQNASAFTSALYDGVWLAALSILAAGKYDGAAVSAAVPSVANNYFGVTGWMNLDSSGNRATSNYNIYEVNPVNSTNFAWQLVGLWNAGSGQIAYNSQLRTS